MIRGGRKEHEEVSRKAEELEWKIRGERTTAMQERK